MGRKSIIKFIYNRQTIQAKGLSMGRTLGAVAIVRYEVLSYVGATLPRITWFIGAHKLFFFLVFFGFGIRGYCRANYVFCSVFQKFIAFSLSLFSKKKKLWFFPMPLNFFRRVLHGRFFFFDRVWFVASKSLSLFIVASDHLLATRGKKKNLWSPLENRY